MKYDDPDFEYPIRDYAKPSDQELRIAIEKFVDKELQEMKDKCQDLEKKIA